MAFDPTGLLASPRSAKGRSTHSAFRTPVQLAQDLERVQPDIGTAVLSQIQIPTLRQTFPTFSGTCRETPPTFEASLSTTKTSESTKPFRSTRTSEPNSVVKCSMHLIATHSTNR